LNDVPLLDRIASLERVDQPHGQRRVGFRLKRLDHRCRDRARAHDVGERDAVATMHFGALRLDTRPAIARGASLVVDDGELPPIAERRAAHGGTDGLLGRVPAPQLIQHQRTEPWIRRVLRQRRPDPGCRKGAARTDRDR